MFLAKNSRHFKYCRCLLAMMTMIFLATATSASTLPAPLTNESPTDYDMRMYSADIGINAQELKWRNVIIDKARYLEGLLSRKESTTFAGLWLEQKPKFRIVVQFAGKPQKNISAYIYDKEVAKIIEVRTATVSLIDLYKIRAKTEAVITNAEINFSSGTDVMKNRVELYITKQDSLNKMSAINKVRAQFPKTVLLIAIQWFC
jgi:hypothetical protein